MLFWVSFLLLGFVMVLFFFRKPEKHEGRVKKSLASRLLWKSLSYSVNRILWCRQLVGSKKCLQMQSSPDGPRSFCWEITPLKKILNPWEMLTLSDVNFYGYWPWDVDLECCVNFITPWDTFFLTRMETTLNNHHEWPWEETCSCLLKTNPEGSKSNAL